MVREKDKTRKKSQPFTPFKTPNTIIYMREYMNKSTKSCRKHVSLTMILLLLVAPLVIFSLIAVSPAPVSAFSGGDGSAQNPYVIKTVDELQAIKTNLNAYYILGDNIDATATKNWVGGFEPIGGDFTGSFDGRGFKIFNLYINRPGVDNAPVGLFRTNAGVIKNVGVENENINGERAGGLIGTNTGTVTNCYTTGYVTATGAETGGLVGANYGTISKSYSTVLVYGEQPTGGLIGYNEGTVTNSFSAGAVYRVGDAGFVGGFIGISGSGTVSKSYSSGYVGNGQGFIGDVGSTSVSDSFWDNDTAGTPNDWSGATRKTTDNMKTVRTYTDTTWSTGLVSPWDFVGNPFYDTGNENIWDINENINNGYPFLSVHINTAPTTPTSLVLTPSVRVGDVLSATASGSTDNENNTITYYYMFYNKNDGVIKQNWNTTNTYTLQTADAHDNIIIYSAAYDGDLYSENRENSIFVQNTKAVAENQKIDNKVNPVIINPTPELRWDYYDSDGDLQDNYHIQVGTSENDNSMWDNNKQSSNKYITYAGTGLSGGSYYYWRIRVYDGYEWSNWLYGGYFRYHRKPTTENLKTEGQTNPTAITTLIPTFSWNYSDPDGDNQTKRQVQVGSYSGDNSVWDSAVLDNATSATYAGSSLSQGTTYYVRVRTYDNYEWSDWASGSFRVANLSTWIQTTTADFAAGTLENADKDTQADNVILSKVNVGTSLTSIYTDGFEIWGTNWSGQSFKFPVPYIDHICLHVGIGSDTFSDEKLYVSIRTDNIEKPGSTIIGTEVGKYPVSDLGLNGSWVHKTVSISYPATITPNTLYWIVLRSDSTNSSYYYMWYDAPSVDSYPDGFPLVSSDSGGSWGVPTYSRDSIFKVYSNVYFASGSYSSQVFDTGRGGTTFENISWGESKPENTNIKLYVAVSSDNSTWSNWAGPYTNKAGENIIIQKGRYVKWKAVFTTDNENRTPVLTDVTINYKSNTLAVVSNLKTQNLINPTKLTTSNPQFSWSYADSDNDNQTQRQIQVGVSEGDNSLWDNTVADNSLFVTYNGLSLSRGTTYYVRARVYDNYDWSYWLGGSFKINQLPTATTLRTENIENHLTITSFTPNFEWNFYDDGDKQIKYQLQVGTAQGENNLWDNWAITADNYVNYNGGALSRGITYYVRVRLTDNIENTTYGDWYSAKFKINSLSQADNLRIENMVSYAKIPYTLSPTFSWKFTDNDGTQTQSHYQIYIGTGVGDNDVWDSQSIASSDNSKQYIGSSLTAGTKYYLQVRLKDGLEWGGWTTGTFIINQLPATENLKTEGLTNPTDINTFIPTFSWDYADLDNDNQTQIQIRVGTTESDNDMWSNLVFDNAISMTYAGKALKRGVVYYISIKTKDNIDWSYWVAGTLKIKQSLPAASNLLTEGMTNPAKLTTFAPTLSWSYTDNDNDNQAQYQIQVGTLEGDNSMWDSTVVDNAISFSSSYAGSTLSRGVTYHWRVRVNDNYDWSSWGLGTFKINQLPVVSALKTDGATDPTEVTTTPTFSWSYSDADGDAQNKYKIQVGSSSGGSDLWNYEGGTGTTIQYAGSSLSQGTTYYVRTQVFDSLEWSSWVSGTFKTKAEEITPPGGGTQPPYYSLSITISPPNSGSAMGSGSYQAGASVTITAYPAENYQFDSWSGYITGKENIKAFSMPSQNISVAANFIQIPPENVENIPPPQENIIENTLPVMPSPLNMPSLFENEHWIPILNVPFWMWKPENIKPLIPLVLAFPENAVPWVWISENAPWSKTTESYIIQRARTIRGITIYARENNLENLIITVSVLDNLPLGLPPYLQPTYVLLQIMQIGSNKAANINNAEVLFRVPFEKIKAENVNENTVLLIRYIENENFWMGLPTSITERDDNFIYFKSYTGGFSFFVVAGQRVLAPSPPEPTPPIPTEFSWIKAAIVIVTAIVGLGSMAIIRKYGPSNKKKTPRELKELVGF